MNRIKLVIYIGTPLFLITIIAFFLISNANVHSLPDADNPVLVADAEISENNLYIVEPEAKPDFPEKHIDVLIYTCLGTRQTEQLLYILEKANELRILPDYDIRTRLIYFDESNIMDAEELNDYDVLIVPGGYVGMYQYFWDRDDIRDWVYNGGGYIGICAGEILAIDGVVEDSIFGPYRGLEIVPNVRRIGPEWVGARNVKMTELGTEKLGFSGDQRFIVWNGSVFYYENKPEQGEKIFAYYDDNSLDLEWELHGIDRWLESYNKNAAIIGDYFGDGRLILSGPHPEISSGNNIYQKYRMVANMIKWVYKDDSNVTYVIGREDVLEEYTNSENLNAMSVYIEKDTYISNLNIYLHNAHGNAALGIYSDNEDGLPGELLTQVSFSAFSNGGWCTKPLNEELFVEGNTKIWLAWISENKDTLYLTDYPSNNGDVGDTVVVSTELEWNKLESGLLPSLFPADLIPENRIVSIFALGSIK